MNVKKGEIFNSVKVSSLPRNTFDLTHQHVTSLSFADLVPICTLETVPGDIFNINCETFMRLQPMITPMMHRCDLTVHYFFVPNRILWEGWEDFITGNKAIVDGFNEPAPPFFSATAVNLINGDNRQTILNYMGCEVNFATKLALAGYGDYKINALPVAAYQKIYYDYYIPRELAQFQAIQYEFHKLISGTNDVAITDWLTLQKKGWGRDYFTSALPYAQKGAAVELPLGEITLKENWDSVGIPTFENSDGFFNNGDLAVSNAVNNPITLSSDLTKSQAYDPKGTLTTGVTTINDLRRAFRLQEWLEKNARAGTRYSESLRVHFDVISSDARLQRAEYITGVKTPIIVSEVLNTTGTEDLPQGNMAGHGIAIAEGYQDSFYCEEHGWIIGMLSVTPKAAYSSGLPRFFTKRMDVMDYFWNEFANIGEQEIEMIELQASFPASPGLAPTDTFGFIPRYAEYKFKNDMITGDFADNATVDIGNLRTWVMQRHYGDNSTAGNGNLNVQFITDDIQDVAATPFAISDTPLMVQQLNKIYVSRQMPVYGTPSF